MNEMPGTGPSPGTAARIPRWLEPQLATLTRDTFSDPGWIYERKLDGERCLAFADGTRVRLMSRNQRDISGSFPEISGALAERLATSAVVADGEIVAFEGGQTSFARLQHRLGIAHPGADLLRAVPVCYYLFDVLHAAGRDVRPVPQLRRKQMLRDVVRCGGPLRYTAHRERDGEEYFRQACEDRWEGLIAKRSDAPYVGGRSRYWLKFKCENSQEFVIGGYTDPRGSRQGLGALLLGYYDADGRLIYAGKVGTGFDGHMLRSLKAALSDLDRDRPAFDRGRLPRGGVHWVEPRLVSQVAFTEWTQDGQLRHPRFLGLRTDKEPAEVVREEQ